MSGWHWIAAAVLMPTVGALVQVCLSVRENRRWRRTVNRWYELKLR